MMSPIQSHQDEDEFVIAVDWNDNEEEEEEEQEEEQERVRRYCLTVTCWIWFLGVILPILGMLQCSGWNEGSMQVESCFLDNVASRGYANILYSIVLISAFMGCIPLCIYGCLLCALNTLLVKTRWFLRRGEEETWKNAQFQELPPQEVLV